MTMPIGDPYGAANGIAFQHSEPRHLSPFQAMRVSARNAQIENFIQS
jgi:hypothetical protein